jgi:hypothetical protein
VRARHEFLEGLIELGIGSLVIFDQTQDRVDDDQAQQRQSLIALKTEKPAGEHFDVSRLTDPSTD